MKQQKNDLLDVFDVNKNKRLNKPDEFTTISIRTKTKERFDLLGSRGDTADKLLNKLMDNYAGGQHNA